MKPTPEQLKVGAQALQDATRHHSVKRDPEAAVAAVYEAMTADHLMPARRVLVDEGLALQVLNDYVRVCIDEHGDDAPASARVEAMQRALTKFVGAKS